MKHLSDIELNEKIAALLFPDFPTFRLGEQLRHLYPRDNSSGPAHDYANDLNAMHDAEKVMTTEKAMRFRARLSGNSGKRNADYISVEAAMCHATARERAEVFLDVMGPS